jgi:DNA-binding transcriptional LysR family regulator
MQWAERIGRRIKLRDLHVLQAVAQAGSMTKAANQLAVSVQVVSKAIADLEHTVGVPLLDRIPQGVEPTAYGRALMHRSVIAFEELRQGIKDIEFLSDPTAGEVRVGIPMKKTARSDAWRPPVPIDDDQGARVRVGTVGCIC